MYKYTIKSEILKAFKRKKKDYSSAWDRHWSWYNFIRKEVSSRSVVPAYVTDYHVPYRLPQDYTFYSKTKREAVPVVGYLIYVHGLFHEEYIPE